MTITSTVFAERIHSNIITIALTFFCSSSDLDTGVRYFLIKSWNHENVIAAQREQLWATQEKNEGLLAEAYKTSRHVILLFSVNKSMAFQGYVSLTYTMRDHINANDFRHS